MKLYPPDLSYLLILRMNFSNTHFVKYQISCSDISDCHENSHSHGFEDHVLIHNTSLNVIYFSNKAEVIAASDDSIVSDFVCNIWQPPQNA